MQGSQKEYLSKVLDALEGAPACKAASAFAKEANLSLDYLQRRSHEKRALALMQPYLLLGKVATSYTVKMFEKLESRPLRIELLEAITNSLEEAADVEGAPLPLSSSAFGPMWLRLWRPNNEEETSASLSWDDVVSAKKERTQEGVWKGMTGGELVEHRVDISSRRCIKREIHYWYSVDIHEPHTLNQRPQGIAFSGPAKPTLIKMLIDEVNSNVEGHI